MKITIHHGHIDHKNGYLHFATADAAAFTAWLAAFCREHWSRWFDAADPDETLPETDEEIVETYFDRSGDGAAGFGEWYFQDETEIEIPQPFASAPDLLIACDFALAVINDAEEIGLFPKHSFLLTQRKLQSAITAAA